MPSYFLLPRLFCQVAKCTAMAFRYAPRLRYLAPAGSEVASGRRFKRSKPPRRLRELFVPALANRGEPALSASAHQVARPLEPRTAQRLGPFAPQKPRRAALHSFILDVILPLKITNHRSAHGAGSFFCQDVRYIDWQLTSHMEPLGDIEKLLDRMDLGLSRLLRYSYGGFLAFGLVSIVHPHSLDLLRTIDWKLEAALVLAVGVGFYAFHRGFVIPVHHLLGCVLLSAWESRSHTMR